MFKKIHRLAKTKDVKKTFAQGRGFFNPYLTVKFAPVRRPHPRFTVVVSTKVSKSAVKRNRIKRILREFIRVNLFRFAPGDYAVVVKPAAVKVEENVLLNGFEDLLKKSKLITL